ncbi:MAG: hypothetical protein GY953_08300 [bacterium]|nr:hypothetical protein [bacterium]
MVEAICVKAAEAVFANLLSSAWNKLTTEDLGGAFQRIYRQWCADRPGEEAEIKKAFADFFSQPETR